MIRLGQKTEKFLETNIQYFAPYLLKDGMVQRMTQFKNNSEEIRTRTGLTANRRIRKVVEKQENMLIEKFDLGRPDRLEELVYMSQEG